MTDLAIPFIVRLIRSGFPLGEISETSVSLGALNWDEIARCAEENAVAPLLYAALKRRPEIEPAPSIVECLRISFVRSDTANWVALQKLASLTERFECEKIPAIVLKGGALVTTLYPEPALRPMSDLDFLIPQTQFAQADALLRELGYESPVELAENFAPRLTNYRAYMRGGNDPAHLEMHWHLFKSPYYWQRVPIDWFWEHTAATKIQKSPARVLAREAQLLHLAAHFALHHRAERLIWSYDLARFIAREREQLNWDAILDTADRFGLIPPLALALERVAQTWDVCAPPDFTTRLAAQHVNWRDRMAFTIMNAPRGHTRFMLDVLSQPGIGNRARLVWSHLFPSRAYMQERYHVRAGQRIPFFYFWRWADGIQKFFRSLVSIARKE